MSMTQEETDNIWRELRFGLTSDPATPIRDLVTKASQKLGLTEEQVYAELRERGWGGVLDQRLDFDAKKDLEPGQGFKRKPTT